MAIEEATNGLAICTANCGGGGGEGLPRGRGYASVPPCASTASCMRPYCGACWLVPPHSVVAARVVVLVVLGVLVLLWAVNGGGADSSGCTDPVGWP